MRYSVFLLPFFVLLIGLSACDFGEPGRDDLAALKAEILVMIGDAPASDAKYCREIAFGSKPCGGPWEYLVYSAQATDTVELARKVARYNRWEEEINEREGVGSDCLFVEPTGVELNDGHCVAATR